VLTLISCHYNNRYSCGIFLLQFVMSTLTSVTSILGSDALTGISLNRWAVFGPYQLISTLKLSVNEMMHCLTASATRVNSSVLSR